MNAYLSHLSAAIHWEIPSLEAIPGLGCGAAPVREYTVGARKDAWRCKGEAIHLCEHALPDGAVLQRFGEWVASPELVFLQLAGRLTLPETILLGLQLCAHPPGNPEAAITTKENIAAFLGKTAGHKGHKQAAKAARHLENGSASVMESLAYMILTLPHTLGGYGIDGAVFNQPIELGTEARKRLGQYRCYADLFFRKAKVAVEYQSLTYHNSPKEQAWDMVRANALERQGIEVLHLNTFQLYNEGACRDFAYNLAARTGHRMQIRAKGFAEAHRRLRMMLPTKQVAMTETDAQG